MMSPAITRSTGRAGEPPRAPRGSASSERVIKAPVTAGIFIEATPSPPVYQKGRNLSKTEPLSMGRDCRVPGDPGWGPSRITRHAPHTAMPTYHVEFLTE